MILTGMALIICGWLIILGQVLRVIPSNLYLSLLAHGISFVGMIVGLIGIVQWSGWMRKD